MINNGMSISFTNGSGENFTGSPLSFDWDKYAGLPTDQVGFALKGDIQQFTNDSPATASAIANCDAIVLMKSELDQIENPASRKVFTGNLARQYGKAVLIENTDGSLTCEVAGRVLLPTDTIAKLMTANASNSADSSQSDMHQPNSSNGNGQTQAAASKHNLGGAESGGVAVAVATGGRRDPASDEPRSPGVGL